MDKYKAQLIAKGFAQTNGIDFFKTYTSIAKFAPIITQLAFGMICNQENHQINVKEDFQNGKLTKDIYMKQLDGYKAFNKRNLVTQENHIWFKISKMCLEYKISHDFCLKD